MTAIRPLHLSHDEPMTTVLAPIAELLRQGVAVSRDTLLMKQVPPDRGIIDVVIELSSGLIALSLVTLAILAIPVAIHSRKMYRKVHHLIDRVYDDIAPIMHQVRSISDNVNFVTTSVRADVQKVNETIHDANERVQQAMTATEQRMNELSALLAVVQQEAEHLFVSTASTVRGMREGAAAFREQSGMDFASDEELDAADLADDIEFQEEVDGHDRKPQSPAPALSAAPRVRPRQRSERGA